MRLLILISLLFASLINVSAADIKDFLDVDGSFLKLKADDVLKDKQYASFRLLSKEKEGVQYKNGFSHPIKFFGMKVWESVIRFNGSKGVDSIETSLYNRGDAVAISEEDFEKLHKQCVTEMSKWTNSKPKTLSRVRMPENKGYLETMAWVKGRYSVIMQWSAGKQRLKNRKKEFRAEFLRVKIYPFNPRMDPRKGKLETRASTDKDSLTDNIVRSENGDVYIDNIPMVDQGLKGYCAVCVTSRVLKYYGSDIGQDTIAQIADSSASDGTNSSQMLAMLKKAGTKFGIKVKIYKQFESRDYVKEVKDYNRLAKKAKKRQLPVAHNAGDFYKAVDPDIYLQYKCEKRKSYYKRFLNDVKKNILLGIPVVWGVQLGLYPEEKQRNGVGGHMRLIIGYNEKTGELLFSDTWGPGHELKHLQANYAWAMTTSYSIFTPRTQR